MQTFLPLENFEESAKVLDYRRLGKQRIEAIFLLKSLTKEYDKKGWINHPARLMWVGSAGTLYDYTKAVCLEWRNRKYKDTVLDKLIELGNRNPEIFEENKKPWFIGYQLFHDSHKSNLLRKNLEHYSKFGWDVGPNLEYFWPSKVENLNSLAV